MIVCRDITRLKVGQRINAEHSGFLNARSPQWYLGNLVCTGSWQKKTNLISGWSFLLDGEQLTFILERLSPEAPERGKIFGFLGQLNRKTSIIIVLDD